MHTICPRSWQGGCFLAGQHHTLNLPLTLVAFFVVGGVHCCYGGQALQFHVASFEVFLLNYKLQICKKNYWTYYRFLGFVLLIFNLLKLVVSSPSRPTNCLYGPLTYLESAGSPLIIQCSWAAGFDSFVVHVTFTRSFGLYLRCPPVISGPAFGNAAKEGKRKMSPKKATFSIYALTGESNLHKRGNKINRIGKNNTHPYSDTKKQ